MDYILSASFIDIVLQDMSKNGLLPALHNDLYADGELHRYSVCGDRLKSKNGWYVIFRGNISVAVYGSWKSGCKYVLASKPKHLMTPVERLESIQQHSKAIKKVKLKQVEMNSIAAYRAVSLWNTTTIANASHPYLVKKRISAYAARQDDDRLVLPIVDCNNKICSLQFINPYGDKILLRDGAKKGNFIIINGSLSHETVLICEGFATGATLAKQHPNVCVISAIDAGNLKDVAVSIRNHKPNTKIIICADDDRLTKNNPGMSKGRAAAIEAGALFNSPKWPCCAPESLSDFNDLACWLEDYSNGAI